jgi:hypothetical protein
MLWITRYLSTSRCEFVQPAAVGVNMVFHIKSYYDYFCYRISFLSF